MVDNITLNEKYKKLVNIIKGYGSAAVAFSGGVDSTLLLKVASDTLGDKVLAITIRSASFPKREFTEALNFIASLKARHRIIETNELELAEFVKNPPDRCYHCKKELFSKLLKAAYEENVAVVMEGSNIDDLSDYRPGRKALEELHIKSPLKEAGLTKEEIRLLSKELKLPTWQKPSYACLSSRFPYREEITEEKLRRIEAAEDLLLSKGFSQVRVRYHGDTARIEVPPEDREKFFNTDFMDFVASELKALGFAYSSLDLQGYRSGSLNEGLSSSQKKEYI